MLDRRTSRLHLVTALLLAGAVGSCGGSDGGQRIVLITLDTLRYDSVHGEQPAMPLLARTADQGMVFDHFYSATSSTQPSHVSMFTGMHPWQHGVTRNGLVLDDVAETLAERLSDAGWSTSAVVASFPLQRRFGFAQGFDRYHDEFEASLDTKATWNGEQVEGSRFFSRARSITELALAELDAAQGDKQFFWFHYFDPHAPYGDSASEDGSQVLELHEVLSAARSGKADRVERVLGRARRLYDRDAAALDDALDALLRRLAEDGDRYETHIVLTADHGESFGEDGSLAHGKRVSRPQVHVPTFIVSPRVSPARHETPAGSVDVMPTVLGLAGLPTEDAGYGRDLIADPTGAGAFGMRRSFVQPGQDVRTDGQIVSVSGPRFFLVQDGLLYIGNSEAVECEQAGAPEKHLVAARRLFANFEFELEHQGALELVDDETQQAMEALGYLR